MVLLVAILDLYSSSIALSNFIVFFDRTGFNTTHASQASCGETYAISDSIQSKSLIEESIVELYMKLLTFSTKMFGTTVLAKILPVCLIMLLNCVEHLDRLKNI